MGKKKTEVAIKNIKFKKVLGILVLIFIVGLTLFLQDDVVNYMLDAVDRFDAIDKTVIETNKYKSHFSYMYIDDTLVTVPQSKEDFRKIYYSFVNSGMKEITIYCLNTYKDCIDDATEISKDNTFLNTLNNYVHPYNSYKYIETEIYNNRVVVRLTHNYTEKMIEEMDNKINKIINENITSDMTTEQKIRVIHDYIINNTKYEDRKDDNYSEEAYSALFNGTSTCGGYTDLMSIFLYKMFIPNYKINSDNHIWNLVEIDGKWYHLDLTWDDPISEFGNILSHQFFLITDEKLKELKVTDHDYDENLFLELKN